MPHQIERRSALRLGALGGALAVSGLAAGGFSGVAGAAVAPGSAGGSPGSSVGAANRQADAAADRIVASVRRPRFPRRNFPVTGFGAAGDGVTMDTAAFAAAIAACHRAGGGHVVVPPGSYLTGAIHLLSNVDLHVQAGATVLFSTDPADYLPVVLTRWQGIELLNYSPMIYCYGQRNVAVTGAGTLDARADDTNWWSWQPLETPDWDLLQELADDGVPVAQRVFGTGHFLPPQMIQPYRSDGVLLQGVTVLNSPFWSVNPNICTDVTVEGLTVTALGPNTDGVDPESCARVVIQDVTFETEDDCVAVKAGRDADGRRVNVPSQDIVIQNCQMAGGNGGITLGSEMSGGIRNIYGRDLTMNSSSLAAGHLVKSNMDRGGYILNSNVYRIDAPAIGGPVLRIEGDYSDSAMTGDFPPDISGITLRDWTVGTCGSVWEIVGAAPTDPVGTVTLDDITVTTAAAASSSEYVTDLQVTGVTVGGTPVTS